MAVASRRAISTDGQEVVRLSPLKEKNAQVVVVAVEGWFYQLVLKHRDKKQGGGLFFSYVLSGERRFRGGGGERRDKGKDHGVEESASFVYHPYAWKQSGKIGW